MDEGAQRPCTGAGVISGTTASDAPITLNTLVDAYLMDYAGRDKARHYRVGWRRARLGECASAPKRGS